jgi:hypothetical protein
MTHLDKDKTLTAVSSGAEKGELSLDFAWALRHRIEADQNTSRVVEKTRDSLIEQLDFVGREGDDAMWNRMFVQKLLPQDQ